MQMMVVDNPRPWMEIIKGPLTPIYITNGVWGEKRRRRGGRYDICNLVASIVSKTGIP